MYNISGSGLVITLIASITFPFGIPLTAFADDADPFDFASTEIGGAAASLNGQIVAWTKPGLVNVTLNLIPGSNEDKLLTILFQANRPATAKLPIQDKITLTGLYPSGALVTITNGILSAGIPGPAVASSARRKTKSYSFLFGDVNNT